MGCYGIGVTRLLAACVDSSVVRRKVTDELRWPVSISPFKVLIIPPKEGSKESSGTQFVYDLADFLSRMEGLRNDVIVDDRTELTVGKRLLESKLTGYPFIVVGAKSVVAGNVPKLELIDLDTGKETLLTSKELIAELSRKCAL